MEDIIEEDNDRNNLLEFNIGDISILASELDFNNNSSNINTTLFTYN